MSNPSFLALVEGLNSQIEALNKQGLNLYDEENRTFFIKKINYDVDEDKLICNFEEEN